MSFAQEMAVCCGAWPAMCRANTEDVTVQHGRRRYAEWVQCPSSTIVRAACKYNTNQLKFYINCNAMLQHKLPYCFLCNIIRW
jgi:hypothetical protein